MTENNIINTQYGEERESKVTGKKVRDYVDNKALTKAIMDYNHRHVQRMKENKPQEKMPDSIGLGIMKIAEGLGSRFNFRGYTYLEEMIGDALTQGVYAVTRFNLDKIMLHHVKEKKYFLFLDPINYKRPKMTADELKELKNKRKEMNINIVYGGRKAKEPNAYGYLTFVMWRAFTARLKSEAEQQKIIESMMTDPSIVCYEADMNDNDHYVDITKENAVDFYFDGK